MTIEEAKDLAAKEFGRTTFRSLEISLHESSGGLHVIHLIEDVINRAIIIYADAKAKEAYNQAIRDAANSAIIKGKKKSVHSKKPRWKNIEENEEVDLFSYEVQYSVNKQSILKLLK